MEASDDYHLNFRVSSAGEHLISIDLTNLES